MNPKHYTPESTPTDFSLVPIEPLAQRYAARDRIQRFAREERERQHKERFATDGTTEWNLPMLLAAGVCICIALAALAGLVWAVTKAVIALAALPLPLAVGIPVTVIAAAALLVLGARHFSTRNEGFAA